jgi:hypothetical protein
MRRCKNAHIRPKHATVPNRHQTAIQNREVEIRIEALAQRNVAAVVDVEGGFDDGFVVADAANDGFEHLEAFRGEDVEAGGGGGGGVGEPGVVFVGEGAGCEFCFVEFGGVAVVAVFRVSKPGDE